MATPREIKDAIIWRVLISAVFVLLAMHASFDWLEGMWAFIYSSFGRDVPVVCAPTEGLGRGDSKDWFRWAVFPPRGPGLSIEMECTGLNLLALCLPWMVWRLEAGHLLLRTLLCLWVVMGGNALRLYLDYRLRLTEISMDHISTLHDVASKIYYVATFVGLVGWSLAREIKLRRTEA
jgi:hypothetical protein